ncbi:MAG: TIGR00341 family protein [Cyclobacteriaceae bacterium]
MESKSGNLIKSVREFFNDLFNLHEDKAREETTIAEITKGVEFKGANLWILIFAVFIASIGLNVNSTAVVIGAMLISPLMGPIMGIGLGAGTGDFALIKKAFKNLSVAVAISVLTSALYFMITPLHEAQSELLLRTTPTLWDVLIAFFGGLAGIVAGSRREKSNAIPGVAIATALMPPLCTAGYGLAIGNWYYFVGAFYLFFINSVFISVSTFLIVRFLKYPRRRFEDPNAQRRVRLYIWTFVLLTIIPSIYLAYHVVRRTLFEQNARNFVNSEFVLDQTQVINQKFVLADEQQIIEVTLYGKPLDQSLITNLEDRLSFYGLKDAQLKINQGYQEDIYAATQQEFAKMSESLKVDIIEDLYKKSEEVIKTKDDRIVFLEQQISRMQMRRYPIKDIEAELSIQYPNLKSLAIGDIINHDNDTICHAIANFSRSPQSRDQKKIEGWLKLRTKADSLVVIIR